MTETTPSTAPTDERFLHADTSMGAVTLRVGDLELMSSYYAHALAMEPLVERADRRETRRVLGRAGVPLVQLIHTPDLPPVDPRQAGLFHTAFLFEDEASLAATVYRAAQDPRSRFTGSADHLVSEAFYFTDPEGNGVELYTDRDRSTWVHEGGQIKMDTLALDPNEYLRAHLTQEALDSGPALAGSVGHVHLQVGDVDAARAFYVAGLGFATQAAMSSAIFASAGGYHHHIAMNTWNSRGAGPRAAGLGLGDVAITVPTREELTALAARLTDSGIAYDTDGRTVTTADPWGTHVTVSLPSLTPDEMLARA